MDVYKSQCQFRVVCFSLHSPPETAAGDRMRLLLRQNAHRFVDLDGLNLAQAAAAIAAEGVHVLVDMNGYTQNARPELFAIFSASDVLSVSLLGFASSLMAHASAALASDRITSPPEMLGSYSERLLYLPDSFYLADHSRSFHTRALNDPGALPAAPLRRRGEGEGARGVGGSPNGRGRLPLLGVLGRGSGLDTRRRLAAGAMSDSDFLRASGTELDLNLVAAARQRHDCTGGSGVGLRQLGARNARGRCACMEASRVHAAPRPAAATSAHRKLASP